MINPRSILVSNLLMVIVSLSVSGCKKDPEYYVRVKNEHYEAVKELKLDAINFGRVEKGTTTDYKYVFPGTFPITAVSESGLQAKGTVTFKDAEGREEWTIVVDANGRIYGVRN